MQVTAEKREILNVRKNISDLLFKLITIHSEK